MTWTGQYDRLFMGGQWVEPESTERIPVVSPWTEPEFALEGIDGYVEFKSVGVPASLIDGWS
ncbi:hypothetical protein [Geodermatophilus sp. CPCC 205506]|uniref:hypothetical protein n=1 Tax=Geodermatophilus sp. CPCC 205506 TaxID=2936596 RepID=UPI003EEBE6FC